MDRRDYFKQYYREHAEKKKLDRRERYARQKSMMWGLFGVPRGNNEETLIQIACYEHRKNLKIRIKRFGNVFTNYSVRPIESGECGVCKTEEWMARKANEIERKNKL